MGTGAQEKAGPGSGLKEKDKNIVVLCGGLSTERNISLISGTKICTALRRKGHRAVLVDMFMGLEGITEGDPADLFEHLPEIRPVAFDGTAPDLKQVRRSRKLQSPSIFGQGVLEICQAADVVFMALHGANGEDGRVQAAFDLLGIPYTGSGYLGAGIAMNKIMTKKLVAPEGVQTPAWASYEHVREEDIPAILQATRIPCVVKTPGGGSSLGVYIVREKDALEPAVRACLDYDDQLLIEQLIEGREFTCAVFNSRPLPSVEIAPVKGGYDYSNKYVAGATVEICPGRCDPAVEKKMGEMALRVHKILGLHTYSRSDFMVTEDNQVYFLEVNTLPGMTPTSLVPQEAAAVGIEYDELCELIVKGADIRRV